MLAQVRPQPFYVAKLTPGRPEEANPMPPWLWPALIIVAMLVLAWIRAV
jgi:hypothetical protein